MRNVLYAYLDGSDNGEIASSLQTALADFVASRHWIADPPIVVNQRRLDDPSLGPADLPDWELGLNLGLPESHQERKRWFADIEKIVGFFGELHARFNRDFVIGIGDRESGISDDLLFIDSGKPDLSSLRQIVGAW